MYSRLAKATGSQLRFAACCMLFLLAGCQGDEEAVSTTAAAGRTGRSPEQQIFDYRLIESKRASGNGSCESDEMLKYTGEQDVLLVTMHMDFFREGEHFSTLTADSGQANRNTRTSTPGATWSS